MTTFTANYAKAAGGKLEIIFAATFSSSTTTDAGFPGAPGNSDIVIKCRVLDASSAQVGITYIRSAVPSSHLILQYPGGNAPWTIEMSDVSHSVGGLGSVSAGPAKPVCILIKA